MAYRIAAPQRSTASVIILHGLGDSGAGWEFLAREFHQRPSMKHINFVLPSAPQRPISAAQGMPMPAWFDLNGLGSSLDKFTSDAEGITKTLEYVKRLVSAEVERGIPRERILVGGFSQGGALTMALAITAKERLAGFLSMSGFLPVADHLAGLASGANRNTPFFMTQGTADDMVPLRAGVASAEMLRKRFGFADLEFETYPGLGHSVNADALEAIAAFVERVLK